MIKVFFNFILINVYSIHNIYYKLFINLMWRSNVIIIIDILFFVYYFHFILIILYY